MERSGPYDGDQAGRGLSARGLRYRGSAGRGTLSWDVGRRQHRHAQSSHHFSPGDGARRRTAPRRGGDDCATGIKVSAQEQKVSTLSGGNQQKVVFARWLASAPKLLLLDEPTRGLDVDAKTEILRLVNELADAGTAVLLVSSELEELTRACDRYLVIIRGQIVAELPAGATREELVNALSLTAGQEAAA